ncbi:MAG: NAD(P)/FAD-dependent oxidoreductase [Candidatus Dormibacteria bacterium]
MELVAGASAVAVSQQGEDGELELSNGQVLRAHAVLVCTGSTYRRLGIPGEEGLIGSGVHFCATCDGPFYRGAEELLVVGGGNAGVEEGMFLSKFAKRIRIVQNAPELTASRLLQDKVRADPRFVIHTSTEIRELRGKNKLEEVVAVNTQTGEESRWHPRAAFVFIGLDPNSQVLEGVAELDQWGFVVTGDNYATRSPWLFAAGDVRAGSTKQLASAAGEGVAALLAVRSYLQKHHHLVVVDPNS